MILSQSYQQTRGPALLLFINVAVIFLGLLAPRFERTLAPSLIQPETGLAYVVGVGSHLSFPYHIASDDLLAPRRSNLVLLENGKRIGKAHTLHDEIRRTGRGAYSHWGESVYFSTSDSTDPRVNGRSYVITADRELHPWLYRLLLITDAALVFLWRDMLRRLLAPYAIPILTLAAVSSVAAAAAMAGGLFGRVNGADGLVKDADLVGSVLIHAALGIAVSAVQWTAGAGLARLVPNLRASLPATALFGYLLSLPLLVVLTAIGLSGPAGTIAAFTLLIVCLVPLGYWPFTVEEWNRIGNVTLLLAPSALGLGSWMGLQWHGPTATLSASPPGDLAFYVSGLWSLDRQLYPFLNLTNAGEYIDYFNMLWPALGAALLRVVKLNPFLFMASSGAAAYVFGLGLALFFYFEGRDLRRDDADRFWLLLFVVISAGRYPTWIVESIPVVHAMPLVVSAWYFVEKPFMPKQILAAGGLSLIGSILSKVTLGLFFMPLFATPFTSIFFMLSSVDRWFKILLAAVPVVFGVFAIYIVINYLPIITPIMPLGPEIFIQLFFYNHPLSTSWPHILRDLGGCAAAVIGFSIVDWPIATVLALNFVIGGLVWPFLFRINFVAATLIFGLIVFARWENLGQYRPRVLIALLLVLAGTVSTDPTGHATGLAWIICISGMVGCSQLSLVGGQRNPPGLTNLRTFSWRLRYAAVWLAAVTILVLVAIGRGHLAAGQNDTAAENTLTPAVLDIWQSVRRLTPPDALIFTDQVSEEMTLLGGWNTFCAVGQRQVFLAGIFVSKDRINAETRRLKLKQNQKVLAGAGTPKDLPVAQRYRAYYAVVARSRPAPPSWTRIYANKDYVLYQIPG